MTRLEQFIDRPHHDRDTGTAVAPPRVTDRPIRVAQVAVALLLLLKLYAATAIPPNGDEAYYWMWGQKLDWSYLDHPPLHSWLLGVMSHLFGWNLFALRGLTWLTLGGTLWIFWLWAKRLQPADPPAWFWPSAAIYLASPMFFLMSSIAFHDHLLILLCLASAHCLLVFVERWERTGGDWRWLYAAATLLGLAMLTKYNGALLGLGFAIFLAVSRPLRPLWRTPHLYLAALWSIVLQAPVLWWNVSRSFASYEFHLAQRWNDIPLAPSWETLSGFVTIEIGFLSPFLLPAIVLVALRPVAASFAGRARTLAVATFVLSTLATLGLSVFTSVYFYWNIVAFVALMPLLAGWMERRWMLYLHLGYGLVIILSILVNYTLFPITSQNEGKWTTASLHGWPEVATRIRALERTHPVGFVATTDYGSAAQLGFAMHDPDVIDLSSRHDQYDIWFDAAAHSGQDALVVADPAYGIGEAAPHFDSLTPLESVPYTAFGKIIYEPTIYLGSHFHAEAKAR
ncbi:MAG: ArnT family glycosyltransferase [Devosia sp.]